ncbi:MAG: hypothetical protein AAF989_11800 [Planctomycetota bacterium]
MSDLPQVLVVSLSSMASFRSSGALFDGHGVEVDVAVDPRLSDFVDGTDTVLDRAVRLILNESDNGREIVPP